MNLEDPINGFRLFWQLLAEPLIDALACTATGALLKTPSSLCLQLQNLRQPCRTDGRRAAEFLLGAASNKVAWHQILTGAVVTSKTEVCTAESSEGLDKRRQPLCSSRQQAVPCNVCAADKQGTCGLDAPRGCWRQGNGPGSGTVVLDECWTVFSLAQ
jgi:hypothetical protein